MKEGKTAEDGSKDPESPGIKALTLRLPDAEYERLRAYAYKAKRKHQDILSEALRVFLDAKTT